MMSPSWARCGNFRLVRRLLDANDYYGVGARGGRYLIPTAFRLVSLF
jgi:hypothetical protein